MKRRTTIEIDEDLLARARRALGGGTTRATVEEALRQAADRAEGVDAARADRQRRYFGGVTGRLDPTVLSSEDMWR